MHGLNKIQEWSNPENKYRFISVNRFAHFLGINQTAVMDLVNAKRLDHVVIGGKTFIPLCTKYFSFLGFDSKTDEDSWTKELWSLTPESGSERP